MTSRAADANFGISDQQPGEFFDNGGELLHHGFID
jgi:hypothetical protein